MSDELEMARTFYGYGRWDAPYWFIGPEPGKGPGEITDNTPRVEAWVELQKRELCDCKEFHQRIGQKDWHRNSPRKPSLQRTWRPLMLLLKTFLDDSVPRDHLRSYQRDSWGREQGETCVIELSALAAQGLDTPVDRSRFREQRIDEIRAKVRNHKPQLVVMYGKDQKQHWRQLLRLN